MCSKSAPTRLKARLCNRLSGGAHERFLEETRSPDVQRRRFYGFWVGYIVLDIFAGSNTTGRAAEKFGRRWVAMELDADYVAGSALRFMEDLPEKKVQQTFKRLSSHSRRQPVDLSGPPTLFDTVVGSNGGH